MALAEAPISETEFLRLPDDGRKREWVNGEAREVPTSFKHDLLVIRLGVLFYPLVQGRGYVTGSQAGFRMAGGNLRSPDLGITRKERLPGGQPPETFANLAPDLCIEIISPSEEQADMRRKVEEYFQSGAEQVWQMFSDAQTLTVYTSPFESRTFQPDDEITGGALVPGLRCRVSALFELE